MERGQTAQLRRDRITLLACGMRSLPHLASPVHKIRNGLHEAITDRSTSIGMFLAQFLRSTALAPWKTGTALHRFDRVVSALCRRALNHSRPYLVLLIDEANNLGAHHWQALKNLQNELDAKGTCLTVISVGTHELGFAHKTLALAGEAHLTARFMVQQQSFRGLRDIVELQYVLQSYDEHSRWPVPDGPSYTEYFAPAAFLQGFRLADAASVMWQVLAHRLPPLPPGVPIEIPMALSGCWSSMCCVMRESVTPTA